MISQIVAYFGPIVNFRWLNRSGVRQFDNIRHFQDLLRIPLADGVDHRPSHFLKRAKARRINRPPDGIDPDEQLVSIQNLFHIGMIQALKQDALPDHSCCAGDDGSDFHALRAAAKAAGSYLPPGAADESGCVVGAVAVATGLDASATALAAKALTSAAGRMIGLIFKIPRSAD